MPLVLLLLGISVADYLAKQKSLSKDDAKQMKVNYSLKFQDFRGSFIARLLPSSLEHPQVRTPLPLCTHSYRSL